MIHNRAAYHDPASFPHPERVDFDRGPTRHMTFGVGPHRCHGSHLARLELRVVYEEMHRRIPNYRLKDGCFIKTTPGMAAGVEALPLVW